MSTVEIRPMRPEDLPRIIEILACWGMAPVEPGPGCPDPERSGLAPGRTLVAEARGRIVGTASYVIESGRLAVTESLAVDPAWIGRGVGEALQRARLAALRARGVEKVRTEADRPRTIAWYVKRFGYRVVGKAPKKHAFGLAGESEWTVLELDLDRARPRET